MGRTVRTNFDRRELRRDRRYPLPAMLVTFADAEYETVNWSLGGFLVTGDPPHKPGAEIEGHLRIARRDGNFSFSAEFVRRDDVMNTVAFRFVRPSAAMIDFLDRVVAQHMIGARRR